MTPALRVSVESVESVVEIVPDDVCGLGVVSVLVDVCGSVAGSFSVSSADAAPLLAADAASALPLPLALALPLVTGVVSGLAVGAGVASGVGAGSGVVSGISATSSGFRGSWRFAA